MPITSEQKVAIYDQVIELVKARLPEGFAITEEPGRLEVETTRDIQITKNRRAPMNLLSVIIQKHHVGFYFMPVYVDTALREALPPELDQMLKGKNCFHVKQDLDDERRAQLEQLIDEGVQLYQTKEWA